MIALSSGIFSQDNEKTKSRSGKSSDHRKMFLHNWIIDGSASTIVQQEKKKRQGKRWPNNLHEFPRVKVPLSFGLIRILLQMSGVEKNPGPKKGSNKVKSVEFIDEEDSESDVKFDLSENAKVSKYQNLAHLCTSCGYNTNFKSSLTRHEKTCTGQRLGTLCCPQGNCDQIFRNLNELDSHLESVHSLTIETEVLEFDSDTDLKHWLTELQNKEYLRYVARSEKGRNSYLLHCHRSGQFARKSRSRGLRQPRRKGSVKSDRVCVSRLKVQKQPDGIRVTYYKTHTGHTISPYYVGLTPHSKRKVRNDVTQRVPKQTILDVRSSNDSGALVYNHIQNLLEDDLYEEMNEQYLDTCVEQDSRQAEVDSLVSDPGICQQKQFNIERTKALYANAEHLVFDEESAKILDDHLKSAVELLETYNTKIKLEYSTSDTTKGNIKKEL